MKENNMILNRLFSQNVFFDLVKSNNNNTYLSVVRRFVNNPENKDNGTLISEVYQFMSRNYRNE